MGGGARRGWAARGYYSWKMEALVWSVRVEVKDAGYGWRVVQMVMNECRVCHSVRWEIIGPSGRGGGREERIGVSGERGEVGDCRCVVVGV